MLTRFEASSDIQAIHAVLASAFPTDAEAKVVDALRSSGRLSLSLVADANGDVVGHVAFSPVTVDGTPMGWGMAPVAVKPGFQRQGIGGALIEEGLKQAKETGVPFVVVLGHPEYYPKFGFERASDIGLQNAYGADEAFMVVELTDGGIPDGGGLVEYCEEFKAFE
jgi:putative acetyltransferase